MSSLFDRDVSEFDEVKEEFFSFCAYCAKKKNIDAIYFYEEYLSREKDVSYEEFELLEILEKRNYITYFDRLGDCYYYGIGCECDYEKAKQAYIKEILYKGNFKCLLELEHIYEIQDNVAEPKGIIKELIEAEDYESACKIRIRIVNMIFEGKVKEFNSRQAYYMLKDLFLKGDLGSYEGDYNSAYGSKPCFYLARALFKESVFSPWGHPEKAVSYYVCQKALDLARFEITNGNEESQEIEGKIEELIEEINSESEIWADEYLNYVKEWENIDEVLMKDWSGVRIL